MFKAFGNIVQPTSRVKLSTVGPEVYEHYLLRLSDPWVRGVACKDCGGLEKDLRSRVVMLTSVV